MTLTDDELENLAQQVIDTSLPAPDDGDGYSFHHDEFIAFARAVEAAEREACAAEMSEEIDFAQLVAQEDEIKLLEAENKRLRDALARISETLADVLDGSRVQEMQVRLGVQQDQVVALEADREKLLQLLTSASEVIGRFVSDEGWAQSDMDTMDHIDAKIASMRRTAQ